MIGRKFSLYKRPKKTKGYTWYYRLAGQPTGHSTGESVKWRAAEYVEKEILPRDPFQGLDQTGVGQLVEIGIAKGRSVRPELKVGICGEHGGDPASVKFCYKAGMDYVSCSPYRVPIARLSAAQAIIESGIK